MSLVFTKKLKNTILAILLFKLFLRDFKRTTCAVNKLTAQKDKIHKIKPLSCHVI